MKKGASRPGRFEPTERTRLRRLSERGAYDRETIHAILDEALYCHLGVCLQGRPCVLPTIHTRIDDRLYFHGSPGNRLLRSLASGADACVVVTLLDGLVLARSVFHHSMNYRSVVVYGRGEAVEDPAEKRRALDALVEHVAAGRLADARPPNEREFRGTLVVSVPLEEASAKIRSGPPVDDEDDYSLDVWAGVLPLRLEPGEPEADPALNPALALPDYLTAYRRPAGGGEEQP